MSPQLAARMVRLAALGNGLFALVWAAVTNPSLAGPGRALFDLLKWPLDGDPAAFDPTARLTSAIGAGVLLWIAVASWTIVAPALERGDEGVRKGAVASFVAWFALDSTGSIAAGAAGNAVWNVVFLILFLAPLVLVRRARASGPMTA